MPELRLSSAPGRLLHGSLYEVRSTMSPAMKTAALKGLERLWGISLVELWAAESENPNDGPLLQTPNLEFLVYPVPHTYEGPILQTTKVRRKRITGPKLGPILFPGLA